MLHHVLHKNLCVNWCTTWNPIGPTIGSLKWIAPCLEPRILLSYIYFSLVWLIRYTPMEIPQMHVNANWRRQQPTLIPKENRIIRLFFLLLATKRKKSDNYIFFIRIIYLQFRYMKLFNIIFNLNIEMCVFEKKLYLTLDVNNGA